MTQVTPVRCFSALLLVACLATPIVMSPGFVSVCVFVLIAAIGAQGVNVVTGYAGQLSFGHAFFLAIGAYTAGVLGGDHGLSALIWVPAAGIVAAVIGALIAPTAVRLRGLYLSIVTIALVLVGQYLFVNLDGLTGGAAGRSIPAFRIGTLDLSPGRELQVGPWQLGRDQLYYYVTLVLLVLVCLYVRNLGRSRVGRAMLAINEGELGAAVLGVNTTRVKVVAFALSAFFAGIAGALYGSYLSYVQPDQWSLILSVEYVAAVIIGGSATVFGPVLGAIVVFALPAVIEKLPFLHDTGVAPANVAAIIYAVVIIAVLLKMPRGLIGLVDTFTRRISTPNKLPPSAGDGGLPAEPPAVLAPRLGRSQHP